MLVVVATTGVPEGAAADEVELVVCAVQGSVVVVVEEPLAVGLVVIGGLVSLAAVVLVVGTGQVVDDGLGLVVVLEVPVGLVVVGTGLEVAVVVELGVVLVVLVGLALVLVVLVLVGLVEPLVVLLVLVVLGAVVVVLVVVLGVVVVGVVLVVVLGAVVVGVVVVADGRGVCVAELDGVVRGARARTGRRDGGPTTGRAVAVTVVTDRGTVPPGATVCIRRSTSSR